MQFIGWVAPSFVRTDAVLDSIISKLQCSVFDMKTTMNKVPACAITLILCSKWRLSIVIYFLAWLFKEKGIVRKPLRTILHFFARCKISNLYLHGLQIY